MKLTNVKIHNVRSIKDADLHLHDYSILIGANNAGKSNIISAIRLFYEDEKMSFKEDRDFPKFKGISDRESWIELEFTTTDEEQENLKDEYKSKDSILKVRRYFQSEEDVGLKKGQANIFAYENGQLSKSLFYGAKNVSQAKLGRVIYIPAISKAGDNLKLSGPSPFRDLVMMIMKGAIQNSSSFKKLDKDTQSFSKSFREESNASGASVNKIVSNINDEMSGWGVKFDIGINNLKPEDIVKNLLAYKLEDETLGGQQVDLELYGQGLQRHLIYSLIKIYADYNKPSTTKAKDFSPDFSLILFEEPEAFLHPSQQDILSHSLRRLSKNSNQQVVITSHSSHFVSKNFDDIPSIINVRRNSNGVTHTHQIKQNELKEMLEKSSEQINNAVKNKKSYSAEDLDIREEEFRYGIYLDSERSSLFFAKHVVICEGETEKALFNCLLDKEWQDLKNKQIYFLDSIGKHNIYRFMALLQHLGIPHSIIHDSDKNSNKKDEHKRINEMIKHNKTSMTRGIHEFGDDLENFLDTKSKRPDRKPLDMVSAYLRKKIDKKKINELRKIVDKIIVDD